MGCLPPISPRGRVGLREKMAPLEGLALWGCQSPGAGWSLGRACRARVPRGQRAAPWRLPRGLGSPELALGGARGSCGHPLSCDGRVGAEGQAHSSTRRVVVPHVLTCPHPGWFKQDGGPEVPLVRPLAWPSARLRLAG